jgi:plastocyanin
MRIKFPQIALVIAALALSACGGGGSGGGGGGSYTPPATGGGSGSQGTLQNLPAQTIGISLPSGVIGVENDPTFGQIGGFTQTIYSQTLAFQTGTTVTLENLGSAPHTLNVLSTTAFPAAGPATTTASGGTVITTGYASGPLSPGATITATLGAIGTYFIGCAFHYLPAPQMRSALIVTAAPNPVPGPQATAGPAGTSGTVPGCHAAYC